MAVITCEVKNRCFFAEGENFGDTGPYEQLDGTVYFAFDPYNPGNAAITDLDLAPRDGNGYVRCSSDFRIIKPADMHKSNGRVLVDVVNRGRGVALGAFNSARRVQIPGADLDPGNGFLMRHGYTVVQCGWQADVPPGDGLRIEVPEAIGPDGPLTGKVVFTFQPNEDTQVYGIFSREYCPCLPNDVDSPDAVLTVRDYEDDPAQIIPRGQWCFARLEDGRLVLDVSHLYMASGFRSGKIYQVTYPTTGSRVTGLGLLAVRDMASFLRYSTISNDNPLAGHVQHAYAFGVSQTGRFLRLFLYLGLNLDEGGRMVFDGLIPHVAGARRAEFNRRFAQLTSLAKRTVSYLFPFNDSEQTDPGSGRRDSLLSRQRARSGVPKVFFTNTSAEYYGSIASLVHTNLEGTQDSVLSENVRLYHFSGTQHGPGALPLTNLMADGARLQFPVNIVDYRPLLRAALTSLDRWVSQGIEPPPSRHPRIDEGTLVPPGRNAATFNALPGVRFPSHLCPLTSQDYAAGLDEAREKGITADPLLEVGKAFTNLVPDVDEDGNELGGIRLPDISVPVATNMGWNLRHPDIGGPDQIIGLTGSSVPFPATRTEREASGDPRLSIEERYASKQDYLDRVKKAGQSLVDEMYMLPEDLERVVEQASQRYDALIEMKEENRTSTFLSLDS